MKLRKQHLWLTLVIASLVLAYIAGIAAAQQPQPGDTPAPVVLPSGGLYASIDCPEVVQAGAVITFDVSGTSAGDVEIEILHVSAPGRPAVPTRAIVFDTGDELVYAWIAATGHYVALWTVIDGPHRDMDAAAFEVTGEAPPDDPGDDPDDPDDPPPDDTAFTKWVHAESEKVRAANHSEVAATFQTLAARITAGELRGSAAIQTATKEALFGKGGTANPAWGPFYNVVFPYMLNELKLSTQAAWASHYRQVAAGVIP